MVHFDDGKEGATGKQLQKAQRRISTDMAVAHHPVISASSQRELHLGYEQHQAMIRPEQIRVTQDKAGRRGQENGEIFLPLIPDPCCWFTMKHVKN